jgi:hypothetical protein
MNESANLSQTYFLLSNFFNQFFNFEMRIFFRKSNKNNLLYHKC